MTSIPRSHASPPSRLPPSYYSAPPTIASNTPRRQQQPQISRNPMAEIIRDPSLLHSGDRSSFNAFNALRGSNTRNSHYSQPSVTASTRSWVYSNQQNPPPPPEEVATPISSPLRTPRPLPDPQYQPHVQPPQNHISVLHTTNGLASPVDEEEEYMNIDASAPGMALGYLAEGLGRGRVPADAINSSRGNVSGGNRSFVGGFVNSLRRLPRVVLKYKTVAGGKRQYIRRTTLGTEETNTDGTGRTTGNTLPQYTSKPSTPVAGPSNLHYSREQPLRMPVPINLDDPISTNDFNDIPSANLGPSLSQRRRRPGFRVTPPSDVMEQDETTSHNHTPAPVTRNSNVTIYNLPQGEDFDIDPSIRGPAVGVAGTETPHSVIPPSTAAPTPNRHTMTDVHTSSHHQQPSTHTRDASNRVPVASPSPQSPVLAHPLPTADYRKMTLSSTVMSPQTYRSSSISDGPSFSSELHPIRRFFRALYRLPWIAPDRVTVDYRPLGRGRTVIGKDSKKPMASWYRGTPGVVLSGSEKLDLLSSGEASKRASANTTSTPIGAHSLVRHRSGDRNNNGNRRHHHRRHHNHNHHSHHHHHQSRNHRRRRTILSTTTAASTHEAHQHHHQHVGTASPIIPTAYPYPYPYPYAYPTFQSASPLMPPLPPPAVQRTQSTTTPRGPRPAPAGPVYPHGYTPFQPPPPTYVITPASPVGQGSPGSGDGGVATGQQMQMPVYMQMQFLPGGLPPSPPPLAATPSGQAMPGTPGPVAAVLQQTPT